MLSGKKEKGIKKKKKIKMGKGGLTNCVVHLEENWGKGDWNYYERWSLNKKIGVINNLYRHRQQTLKMMYHLWLLMLPPKTKIDNSASSRVRCIDVLLLMLTPKTTTNDDDSKTVTTNKALYITWPCFP